MLLLFFYLLLWLNCCIHFFVLQCHCLTVCNEKANHTLFAGNLPAYFCAEERIIWKTMHVLKEYYSSVKLNYQHVLDNLAVLILLQIKNGKNKLV